MKKSILALAAIILGTAAMFGQAKKPTLMVMPGETWCFNNGYTISQEYQGQQTRFPDYARAVQENADLVNVITKIGELMADRGFPLKDLSSNIRSIERNRAENEVTMSRTSGASIAESPLDKLLTRAKADIVVELTWQLNTTGPKTSVTYNMRGIDAYTNKQVAAAQGTGAPSFSAGVPELLEEAVLEKIDGFTSQLQAHFDDMLENGREVSLYVRMFDNGSGASFEDEFGGEELTDIIDDWMAKNTVNHRYSLTDATDDMLFFEQVRIPLYRENGAPMDTRHFTTQLRKFLQASPYGMTSKILTKGLGRADLVIGEK